MPLVVPVLRFIVVFLNVYETFKTLKPPPPSARRGGQPSVRAVTQRKRDLKGCLAVWAVWCCYTVYERTFDRLVGIFFPFYSEIKSVFLFFLLLTRAKGAEPLFLHVLRPFVKPYAAVVDPILEISRDAGDFFFALLQVPFDRILSSPWFSSWRNGALEEQSRKVTSSPRRNLTNFEGSVHTGNLSDVAAQPSRKQDKCHGSVCSITDKKNSNDGPTTSNFSPRISHDLHSKLTSTPLPAYSEQSSRDPAHYSQTLCGHSGHQIWYPPVPVYPTSNQQASDVTGIALEYHSSEWRTYPAFPSAYPPTPLPPSASLPSPVASRPDNDHHVISDPQYPPIPEHRQGFNELLERQHEGHPGPVHGSSNNRGIPPGANSHESRYGTMHQDDDILHDDSMCSSEASLSDDFGASLRTPHHLSKEMPSAAYSSTESLTGALTTTDNATSLRTKTSSDSLSSGSSSLAGQKRTHGAFQGRARSTFVIPQSRNGTLRARVSVPKDPLQSSPSEGEDESEPIDDDGGAKAKRQRVLDPVKRRSTVRPVLRGTGSTRRASSSGNTTTRGRPLATASQATLRKAGPIMTNDSTIKGKKPTYMSRQVTRGGSQRVVKSSSTSSSWSGTLKGRMQ